MLWESGVEEYDRVYVWIDKWIEWKEMRRNTSNTSTQYKRKKGGGIGKNGKKEFRKSAKTNYRVLLHAHENKKRNTQQYIAQFQLRITCYLPACQSVAARGYCPSFGPIWLRGVYNGQKRAAFLLFWERGGWSSSAWGSRMGVRGGGDIWKRKEWSGEIIR